MRYGVVVLVGLLFACTSPSEPEAELKPSYLATDTEGPWIEFPDSVRIGQEVRITIQTFGPSDCWEKGSDRVQHSGLAVSIYPADVERSHGKACADVFLTFRHEFVFSFDQAGTAEIEIHGRQFPESDALTVKRQIVVSP